MMYVAHMREMRNVFIILIGTPEMKKPLRRSRHRWEDNEYGSWINRVGSCGLGSSGLC
jgi:hypothetical protein